MPEVSSSKLASPFVRTIIGFMIGFSFLITGCLSASRVTQLRSRGVEVEGKVVALRIVVRKRNRNSFPTVEFTDSDEVTHQKEMSIADLDEGDTATVLYLPDNPEIADLKSVATSVTPWFGYFMMGLSLIGWGIAGYNGAVLLKSKKQPA